MGSRVLMAQTADPDALGQWHRLRDVVEAAGAEVTLLPSQPDAPGAEFVRDLVVVTAPEEALVLRPHGPRGDVEPPVVAAALRGLGWSVTEMPAGLRLDGGQVVRDGDRWLVGIPPWSSRRGERWLAERLPGSSVTAIPLGAHTDHLDVLVASLDGRGWLRVPTLLAGEASEWDDVWRGRPVLDLPGEAAARLTANVVTLGSTVIGDVSDVHERERVAAFLAGLGLQLAHTDLSALRARRGAAHCLTVEC